MGHFFKTKKSVGIGLFLFAFALVFSLNLSATAQECKGPNRRLTVTDIKGEITSLTCGYIGSETQSLLYSFTESRSEVNIEIDKVRRITPLRDPGGKVIAPYSSSLFAIVELKNGDSRRLRVITFGKIGGYSSWGRQTFDFDKVETIEFE